MATRSNKIMQAQLASAKLPAEPQRSTVLGDIANMIDELSIRAGNLSLRLGVSIDRLELGRAPNGPAQAPENPLSGFIPQVDLSLRGLQDHLETIENGLAILEELV